MGITGLIPFISEGPVPAVRKAHIRDMKGQTAALDAYVLLHRGAYGCARELFEGRDTDKYVRYCMQYIDMLLVNGIKPIVVFDGAYLAAKQHTELERRTARKTAKRTALELVQLGKHGDAYSHIVRAIDVTHHMALKLIQRCRARQIDCIVAPYEADAQLAYLNRSGLADFVITEDSDLIVFGCDTIAFKLQLTGEINLYERTQLEKVLSNKKVRCSNYSFEKFRVACILSGCDYAESLPGIGLGKAWRFVSVTDNVDDLNFTLPKLPKYLNMPTLEVTPEYIAAVKTAHGSFKHQIVYDPIARIRKPLEDFHEDNGNCLVTAGTVGIVDVVEGMSALYLALGNIDPMSNRQLDVYDPQKDSKLSKYSIWNSARTSYKLGQTSMRNFLKPKEEPTVVIPAATPKDDAAEVLELLGRYSHVTTDPSESIKDQYFKGLFQGQCAADVKAEAPDDELLQSPKLSFLRSRRLQQCPYFKASTNKYDKLIVTKRKANVSMYFADKQTSSDQDECSNLLTDTEDTRIDISDVEQECTEVKSDSPNKENECDNKLQAVVIIEPLAITNTIQNEVDCVTSMDVDVLDAKVVTKLQKFNDKIKLPESKCTRAAVQKKQKINVDAKQLRISHFFKLK